MKKLVLLLLVLFVGWLMWRSFPVPTPTSTLVSSPAPEASPAYPRENAVYATPTPIRTPTPLPTQNSAFPAPVAYTPLPDAPVLGVVVAEADARGVPLHDAPDGEVIAHLPARTAVWLTETIPISDGGETWRAVTTGGQIPGWLAASQIAVEPGAACIEDEAAWGALQFSRAPHDYPRRSVSGVNAFTVELVSTGTFETVTITTEAGSIVAELLHAYTYNYPTATAFPVRIVVGARFPDGETVWYGWPWPNTREEAGWQHLEDVQRSLHRGRFFRAKVIDMVTSTGPKWSDCPAYFVDRWGMQTCMTGASLDARYPASAQAFVTGNPLPNPEWLAFGWLIQVLDATPVENIPVCLP